MAKLPRNFLTASPVTVSFDWTDIASGTGYTNFYAGNTVDTYRLSDEAFYSDRVMTGALRTTSLALTKEADVDFDVEFLTTRVIDGKTIINVPIGIVKDSDSETATAYVVVRVYHVDAGASETQLATNQGTILTNPSGGGNNISTYFVSAIDVDIPRTTFKAGEILRLTVELWVTIAIGGQAVTYFFGHDPMNRATTNAEQGDSAYFTFSTEPSILTFQVPFKLTL